MIFYFRNGKNCFESLSSPSLEHMFHDLPFYCTKKVPKNTTNFVTFVTGLELTSWCMLRPWFKAKGPCLVYISRFIFFGFFLVLVFNCLAMNEQFALIKNNIHVIVSFVCMTKGSCFKLHEWIEYSGPPMNIHTLVTLGYMFV